jgi:multiple sugar transport system permease protein
MTAVTERPATAATTNRPGSRRRVGSWRFRPGHLFVSGYVVLLAAFGVFPVLYSIDLALTDNQGRWAGLANFTKTFEDFRFLPAIGHVALYLLLWLVSLTVLVVVLALVVHRVRSKWGRVALRFAYYIPGALAGASSVVLWLFVLNPTVSPVSALLRWTGSDTFTQVISTEHLPVVFTIIAFWTGAGGWILVLYGALNTIPLEVVEAAKVDGAGSIRTAWHVELPMIRKWVAYMLILSLAAGTQLFVEPQLMNQASLGIVSNDYSVNQLAYQYAFAQNDFNGSAALSIDLLIVALLAAAIFVAKGRLFETEPD